METTVNVLDRLSLRERLAQASLNYDADPRTQVQRKVDRYNGSAGHLTDGYDCPLCLNRGEIAVVIENGGAYYDAYKPCECMAIRASIKRMRESGLDPIIGAYSFDRFEARELWQQKMLETAREYLNAGVKAGKWLYMGGAVGCGKTHICTAVCAELLRGGMNTYYMRWQDESQKIKAMVTDEESYARAVNRLKNVSVLYIDDLFKPTGDNKQPTAADIKLAYEIINHRYLGRMPTIISSERYLTEVLDIDEAVGSRIYEQAKGFALKLGRDRSKNQRLI